MVHCFAIAFRMVLSGYNSDIHGMGLTKEYVINFIGGGSPLLAPLFEIMSAEDAKAFVKAHWDSI